MVSANNAINNTIGASISGVTNTLTVTNASNTASSAARSTITVGGGSAADPTLNFNVSGVTDFEMGIDNSSSDRLTISQSTALGTNDVWRMTPAGERTMPLQPAFLAYANATLSNLTGNSTLASPIIFNTEVFDQNSDYNNATGLFTAPVTGIYVFHYSLGISGLTAAHVSLISGISLNGTTNSRTASVSYNPSSSIDATFGNWVTSSCVVSMTAMDTYEVYLRVDGGAQVVSVQGNANREIASVFSGYLLY